MSFNKNNIYLEEIRLNASEITYKESQYWHELMFYRDFVRGKRMLFDVPVIFIVGENGCGKSTLIEAIAVKMGYNAEGGSRNFNFSTRYSTSGLYKELTAVKTAYIKDGFFLRAESFYNVASNIEKLKLKYDSYGGKTLHERSHGESFLELIQNRFRGDGLYILDEPESALSPMRQLTLMAEINRLVGLDSQFIIATHSPILMSFPCAKIYCIDNGINEISYIDTDHYRMSRDFLNNPNGYLKRLISEE